MRIIDPKTVPLPLFHNYLLGAVTPRPIALASTIDINGVVNLSPFSFFNCFGANPPILIFSPSRRVRDNTLKHTYENVLAVPEVVIHIVSYDMVQQTSLSSTEYPKGINEFEKAGFTAKSSVMVRPPRVVESPIAMECKVINTIPTGDQGGAGNLVICEVLLMHLSENILTGDTIDPIKLDAVCRLGGDWYGRISQQNIFRVPKPLGEQGIGIDQLPDWIRNSKILTGNDLGLLANVHRIPIKEPMERALKIKFDEISYEGESGFHNLVRLLLDDNRIGDAWQVLLHSHSGS